MNNKPYYYCILILQQKIIVQIEIKTYNIDEKRVLNTDLDWICQKIHFQLEIFATVIMMILKKWLEEEKIEDYWVFDNI
jgi:hypothetical protein